MNSAHNEVQPTRAYERSEDDLRSFVGKQKAFLLTMEDKELEAIGGAIEALDSLTLEELREEERHLDLEYRNRGY